MKTDAAPTSAVLLSAGSEVGELNPIVTGRSQSLFADDLGRARDHIDEKVRGRRILVVGGGGSIGSATVRLLVDYQPLALHILDQDENSLAELVRELRGRPNGISDIDLRTLPLDYGAPATERLLANVAPYDAVFNFAALKHVRSEKDIYSVIQMFDTNIVRHTRFRRWLVAHRHARTYFAVSTDKAANPVSVMGASKRLMEDLIFDVGVADYQSTTSARFANVAFSNGSLLQGFGFRLAKRQPLAVPRETRRYFISDREAAELCLLAVSWIADRHIAVPRVDTKFQLQLLEDVADKFLACCGFAAERYSDERLACRDVERLAREGRWPLLITTLDTSGEKPFEEFVGEHESAVDCGLLNVSALHHIPCGLAQRRLFEQIAVWVNNPAIAVSKRDFSDAISAALPSFRHADSERLLDQRL